MKGTPNWSNSPSAKPSSPWEHSRIAAFARCAAAMSAIHVDRDFAVILRGVRHQAIAGRRGAGRCGGASRAQIERQARGRLRHRPGLGLRANGHSSASAAGGAEERRPPAVKLSCGSGVRPLLHFRVVLGVKKPTGNSQPRTPALATPSAPMTRATIRGRMLCRRHRGGPRTKEFAYCCALRRQG